LGAIDFQNFVHPCQMVFYTTLLDDRFPLNRSLDFAEDRYLADDAAQNVLKKVFSAETIRKHSSSKRLQSDWKRSLSSVTGRRSKEGLSQCISDSPLLFGSKYGEQKNEGQTERIRARESE
jgi:hypothetical protein